MEASEKALYKIQTIEQIESAVMEQYLDRDDPEGVLVSFKEFRVHENPFDGMGCHIGIDHSFYYDLYRGNSKIISMNDWRLEEMMGSLDADTLTQTLSSLKKVSSPSPKETSREQLASQKKQRARRVLML